LITPTTIILALDMLEPRWAWRAAANWLYGCIFTERPPLSVAVLL